MKRLAILSTHPIQYNSPLFRMLDSDENIQLKVFFSKAFQQSRYDPEFQAIINWDTPVLEGFSYEFFAEEAGNLNHNLTRNILRFCPHAVLVYGWNFRGHFAVMRNLHGTIPIWFRGDSTMLNQQALVRKALRMVALRFVYKHIDLAFHVGIANREYFLKGGLKQHQLRLAPHAVDNDFFSANHLKRMKNARAKRKAMNISDNAFVFLFVGKLDPIKQPLALIEAFKELAEKVNKEVHLILVGKGQLQPEVESMQSESKYVHAVGFKNQSEMPIWYRMANALCLPSTTETWGLCVNEAIASNNCKLMLSNRVGCSLEFRDDPFTAIVPPDDTSDWQNCMEKLISLPAPLPSRQKKFFEHFSLERTVHVIRSELSGNTA